MKTTPETQGKSRTWTEISCDVPETAVDAVADFLVCLTGGGVTVENRFVDAFSPTEIAPLTRQTVKAYLPPETEPEEAVMKFRAFLLEQRDLFPDGGIPKPAVDTVSEEDWAGTWKLNFTAMRIGERIIVKPTWEEHETLPGEVIIDIDPGMAFGTGTHPTTRLCLRAVEDFFTGKLHAPLPLPKVLDVGTGSGILAIAAAKMGGEVSGLDIDPDAVETAAANAELNGVGEGIVFSADPLEEITGGFDLILANILAEELVRLSTALAARLNPGGILVLSGILSEKDDFVLAGFAPSGLAHVRTEHEEEWSGIVYRRPE